MLENSFIKSSNESEILSTRKLFRICLRRYDVPEEDTIQVSKRRLNNNSFQTLITAQSTVDSPHYTNHKELRNITKRKQ